MPIITISRGTFSGGKSLAECVATELEYSCVSREILVEAAQAYGVSEADLGTAMTRAPGFFDRLTRDRDRYLIFVKAALCQRAKAGNFIYHGNAGHHLLAGIKHVLRVRVVADISYRVQRCVERMGMTSRQAEVHIKKVDRDRERWTQLLYGVAWDDPRNYDVVLNLERLNIQGACTAVRQLALLQTFQPTKESIKAMEDLALSSLVLAKLAADDRTRDGAFSAQADDGVVTVSGTAKLAGIVEAVSVVAAPVSGVRKLVNNVVLPSFLV